MSWSVSYCESKEGSGGEEKHAWCEQKDLLLATSLKGKYKGFERGERLWREDLDRRSRMLKVVEQCGWDRRVNGDDEIAEMARVDSAVSDS